jgi:hypothetical protein
MNNMSNKWFEELPEQCPPNDAEVCNGIFYRIANGNPVTSEDFFSQRKMYPNKVFRGEGIDDCVIKSVSLFSNINEAMKRLKLPKFKRAVIAEVKLGTTDGMIKKTFGFAHYSWWRSKSFDVSQSKIVHL